jgi:AcrR family transcriptional regulator
MPRTVDHDARRREIIDALFRVAVRDGLAAASVRAVATEAGVPAPQVQYYFPTKAAMLDAAMYELGMRIVGRGMALQAEAGPTASPEILIRLAIAGSRPVDDTTRQELVLFFLFFVEALTDAETVAATRLVPSQQMIVAFFAQWIREAQTHGEVDSSLNADHEARLLLWANTGLVFAALAGVMTVDDAAATIDYQLARIFRQQVA